MNCEKCPNCGEVLCKPNFEMIGITLEEIEELFNKTHKCVDDIIEFFKFNNIDCCYKILKFPDNHRTMKVMVGFNENLLEFDCDDELLNIANENECSIEYSNLHKIKNYENYSIIIVNGEV